MENYKPVYIAGGSAQNTARAAQVRGGDYNVVAMQGIKVFPASFSCQSGRGHMSGALVMISTAICSRKQSRLLASVAST